MLEDKNKLKTVLDLVYKEREAYADFFYESQTLNMVMNSEGKFSYVNSRWAELTSFSEEELCAIPFLVYIHPDDISKTQKMFNKIKECKSGVLSKGFCCRFRKLDGDYQRVSWISATIDENQHIMAVCLPLDKNEIIVKGYDG
jgi:PAS domain S-box-containing protein|tara:strand:+ start:4087 stop:4515 length:429 start_codon:yes stop_codon:yes gene_type:complete